MSSRASSSSEKALSDAGGGQIEVLVSEAVDLAGQKKHAAALKVLERALALDPSRDEAAAAMILLLDRMKGRKAAGDFVIEKLGLSGPEDPRFQKLLADVLVLSDKAKEAVSQYEFVLKLVPDYAGALGGLGAAYQFLRRFDEAARCFEKALQIRPSADLLGKTGGLLLDAGHPVQALTYFDKALEIEPDNRILIANRAAAAYRAGRFAEAFRGFSHMLELDPEDGHARKMLATVARNVHLEAFSPVIKKIVGDSLASDFVEHQYFMALWRESLALDPVFVPLVTAMSLRTWDAFCAGFDPVANREMLSDSYLCSGLRMLAMRDLDLERFLTFLRRYLLDLAAAGGLAAEEAKAWMPFSCALAEHCFFNEYVFDYPESDRALAGQVAARVADPETAEDVARFCAAVAACCEPLSGRGELHARIGDLRRGAPSEFGALCVLQIDEPLEERKILPTIPVFGAIGNTVSRKVREQYEANPYPRWRRVSMHGTESGSAAFLRPLKILVAGCGTGRQPIDVHYAYPRAQITAVDLSSASLSYATRKTREAGIKAIKYMQGDILELGSIDERFDLIMCSGVLHHMENPEKGLAVLEKLLVPGGQINLGLYSEWARRQVVAAREYAREKGWQGTSEGIRALRAHIAALPKDDPMRGVLAGGFDFYTMSSCRDLLFHVQEHRYTLPQIGEMLDCHGLAFLYFSTVQADFLQAFRAKNPQAGACLDLKKWDAFECAHPDAFYGMYQFYVCRKQDEAAIRAAPRLVRAVDV